jgi:universal stress protein E
MEAFKSILVDVDATATAHPALERAVRLAGSLNAALTVTDVVTVPPHARRYMPPTLEEDMVRDRRQQLARVASAVNIVRAEPKLLVGRPATVLIQEVLRSHHDLLMRSHARELAASRPKPFGAVDMELLRKCPCPVLLSRHGSPASRPQIVAAVNASTEEPEEQALNERIVDLALLMASHLEADPPKLLQVWTPFAEQMVPSVDTQNRPLIDT